MMNFMSNALSAAKETATAAASAGISAAQYTASTGLAVAKTGMNIAKETTAALKERAVTETEEVRAARYARLERQLKNQTELKLPVLPANTTLSEVQYAFPAASSASSPPAAPDDAAGPDHAYGSFSAPGEHAWSALPGRHFRCRIGPNYRATGAKAPSADPLYEACAQHVFRTDAKPGFVAPRVPLPPASAELRASHASGAWTELPLFILTHTMIPDYVTRKGEEAKAPADGRAAKMKAGSHEPDGENISLVTVYRLRLAAARQAAARVGSEAGKVEMPADFDARDPARAEPAALALADRFCAADDSCEAGHALRKRLKCIVAVRNHEEAAAVEALGSMATNWLKLYNAKPFLGRPQNNFRSFLLRPEGQADETPVSVQEVLMDVHRFTGLPILPYFIDALKCLVLDTAVVIEARGDEEQPEQVLGAVRLVRIDLGQASRVPAAEAPA
jgi:hypothetical protein